MAKGKKWVRNVRTVSTSPPKKLIHERRTNDRQDDGKEEREPQRGRFRHTYDSVLHKPTWQEAIRNAKARTGES
jgi:hypothetical protein